MTRLDMPHSPKKLFRKYQTSSSRKYKTSSSRKKRTKSKCDRYLSLNAFTKLLKNEYRYTPSESVLNSCYHTWFKTATQTSTQTKDKILNETQFLEMYKKPDGFLRDFI
jgi:hypothetical protein